MLLNNRDQEKYQTFTRRAAVIGGLQALVFGGLAARMYYLQVIESQQYKMLAEENRVNVRLLAPLRGKIVDRFGVELASNRQNFRVVLVPEQTENINTTLDELSEIISISEGQREKVLEKARRSRSFVPITVVENLTWEEFAQVNVNGPQLPGIQPEVGDTRAYPFGEDLAHVLGYVAAVSEEEMDGDPMLQLPGFRVGKNGIEKSFDQALRGSAGTSRVEVNAYGRVVRELHKDPGEPGEQIELTIDMDIQKFASERVRGESASVVVMDIHSGEVLTLVSSPGFDPDPFNTGLSHAQWKAWQEDPYNPLLNKAIAGQYPPGSTFKMVVGLAALESNLVNPSKRVFCNGQFRLGNRDFHCWKRGGHGAVNLHEAIKHSCDVYFYDVATQIGIDRIEEMAKKFGLGHSYDFELPGEKSGLVPSRGWRKATSGISWQKGDTVNAGIGQGFLLTTPLQLCVMAARIANGGHAVTPHLVRSVGSRIFEAPEKEPLGVAEASLEYVKGGMNAVSNEIGGTAYGSRIAEPGMELAGKTGTAQVRRITAQERQTGVLKNEDLEWRQRDHALFVAFAPVDAPRYAISVVIEHGGSGSRAAAPVARDVMRKTLERDPMRQLARGTGGAGGAAPTVPSDEG